MIKFIALVVFEKSSSSDHFGTPIHKIIFSECREWCKFTKKYFRICLEKYWCVLVIISSFKVKLFAGAVLILLTIYCIALYVQQEEIEKAPAIEFSLQQAQYANKSNHFDRHTVVSNGPECASIGL